MTAPSADVPPSASAAARASCAADADPQIVFRADADGALVEATGWETLTGQQATAFTGDGWLAMVHPEDREGVRADWNRHLAAGEPHEFDCRLRVSEDAWRWMQVRAAPVRAGDRADGRVINWLGTMRDLRHARMTRTALVAGDVTMFEWDTVRQRVWGDSQLSRMFGIEMDADGTAPVERYLRAVHPDDREGVLAAIAQTVEGGQDYTAEYRVVVAGVTRWMLVRARSERDATGRVVRSPGMAMDVTERREAQEELQRRSLLLRAISDSTGDVIYAKDREGRLTYANPATLALVGKPAEQVLGHTDAELLADAAAAQRVMANDRRIMKSGAAEEIEEVVPRPDGTRLVWASHKMPYRDERGQVIGLLGVSRDVTERVEARRRLDAALTAGEVGTFEWEVGEDRLYGDANFARMFGLTLAPDGSAPLEAYLSAINPDDRPRVRQRIEHTLETGAPYETEYRIGSIDAIRWVTARGTVERDAATGKPLRFPGTILDITARKAAEEALQRSEARWNSALEHLREGVVIATESEQLIYWNPSARRMHGVGLEREVLMPLEATTATFEILALDGRPLPLEEWPMRRVSRGEPVEDLELRVRRVDQPWEKIVSYSGMRVETGSGERLLFLTIEDLTDRRQAEAAARQREATLEAFFDASPGTLLILDDEFRHVKTDRLTPAVLGLTRESIVGTALADVAPGFLERFGPMMRRVIETGEPALNQEVELPVRGRPGESVFWRTSYFPVPLPEGRRGLGVVGMDITDMKRADAALAAERALRDAILDHLPVGVSIHDAPSAAVLAVNRAGERLLGHRLIQNSDLAGLTAYGALHEDGRPYAPEEYPIARAAAFGETVDQHITRYRRGDGRITHIAVSAAPVYDAEGRRVHAVSAWTDVGERVGLEQALRETASRLNLFVEHAPAQIALFDREMNYLAASRAWWDAFAGGVDMTGRNHYALWPDLPLHFKQAHARALRGEVVSQQEDSFQGRDGRPHWLRWAVHPWRDAGGGVGGVVVFSEDITEQRQADEHLRAAQRMETAGRIAGGVAHEANNQMTVALAAAAFLLERDDLAAEARSDVVEIQRAAERTAGICQQLLAFSRRQVLRPEVLDADAVVRGAQGLLARTLGAGTTLEVALDAPGAYVSADRGQLEQVLLNLVLNARDALEGSGTVRLRSRLVTRDAPVSASEPDAAVARTSLAAGAYWTLSVEDTGTGMDAATLARASEPFFTTKPTGQGTGLGLSVVQGVLRQSGGDMALESAPGRGTTVHLFLPRLHSSGATVSATPAPSALQEGRVVWLVDDEPALRRMAARALGAAGYVVRSAASADEALELIRTATEPPACVVSDMVMPGQSGVALATALRERWPAVPILLMSGYPDADRRTTEDTVAIAFLAKPFAPRELVTRVTELVRHPAATRRDA